MKKRLISMLLAICMFFSLLPAQALAAGIESTPKSGGIPFSDIKKWDWYYAGVKYVFDNKIFNGISDDTFWPEGTMTRGMFVTMLGRMAGVDSKDYPGASEFTDVVESAFYAPYVVWAAQYGITSGIGDGQFLPDAEIDRQQMAGFFMNYFKAFEVDYATGANVTTEPADLEEVAPWAREAVLALWKEGLLNGDGKRFNPTLNAARAEAAVLCQRFDNSVKTWYSEPGVPSERVPVGIDPPEPTPTPTPTRRPGGGSSSGGDITNTDYYEVTFALGTGEDTTGVTLPEKKLYPDGTKLTDLPIPYKQNAAFLGWYTDAALTEPVTSKDTLTSNITLYGKMAALDTLNEEITPTYDTQKLAAGAGKTFTFQVTAASVDELKNVLTITDVTGGNASIPYTVTGSAPSFTVTPKAIIGANGDSVNGLEDGKTYKITLTEESTATFTEKPESVRSLNVVTEKTQADELKVTDGMKYIEKQNVGGNAPLEGLFTATLGVDGSTRITPVSETGTFTYSGNDIDGRAIIVGDTVAIYEGTRPDERGKNAVSNGYVAYVVITAVNGTSYNYRTAEAEEVLFTPDVLPFDTEKDSNKTDGLVYTASKSDLDFSGSIYANLGLGADTTIDVGDFIAFYTGDLTTAQSTTYGKITGVSLKDDIYTITYVNASQAELMAAMDLYSEQEQDIKVDEAALEDKIEAQAIESGFADESALYLAALALETDGFRELADDFDYDLTSYSITTADGQPLEPGELELMANSDKVGVEKSINVTVGKEMQHFTDRNGMRIELDMNVTLTVNAGNENAIEIKIDAIFEQEVVLGLTVSGGAEWRWAWIIPYIYDYNLSAAFTAGTYTGIGITATASTKGAEDEAFDWKTATDNKYEKTVVDIGKQINDLMKKEDEFLGKKWSLGDDNDDAGENSVDGSLTDKYAAMIESADDTWIDICRVQIYAKEGAIDKLNILVYSISADFVVSANVYVTLGMSFTYSVAKEYVFSVSVFHKGVTSEVVDLEESNYRFDFYVMGTLGIRAGIEFEIAVGLFSIKLDSVGFTAEAGVYAQLWGFFYYSTAWSVSGGSTENYSGALCFEVGAYLEITFKAQMFGDKLKFEPTLYANQWPFWTAGESFNIIDFTIDKAKTDPETNVKPADVIIKLVGATNAALPEDMFTMTGFDLQSGDIYDGEDGHKAPKNFDDDTESHFSISISDPMHFEYYPASNTILVKPGEKDWQLEGTMTITWNQAPLSFNKEPISRTVQVKWETNPENTRYIAFNTWGGTTVDTIIAPPGEAITAPSAPTKQGWEFVEWRLNGAPYTFPATMPTPADGSKGITLEAAWEPGYSDFAVELYQQELNGNYTKYKTSYMGGATGQKVSAWAKYDVPDGFVYNAEKSTDKGDTQIMGDGSATVQVYFDRKTYNAAFSYGEEGRDDQGYFIPDVVKKVRYGEPIVAPVLTLPGYEFVGWFDVNGTEIEFETRGEQIAYPILMPADNVKYTAKWTANGDTPYKVNIYQQKVAGDGYDRVETLNLKDTTGSRVPDSVYTGNAPEGCNNSTYTIKVGGQSVEKPNVIVKGDGTLELNVYYERMQYTVTFERDGGDCEGFDWTTRTGVRHGTILPITTISGYAFHKDGYTYNDDWIDSVTKEPWIFGTTPVTKDVTIQPKWVPNGATAYTVEHYLQDLTGDTFTRHGTPDELTGTTGDTVNASPRTMEGFTFDRANPNNVTSGTVKGDGTLVLKLYYTRDEHTVTFKTDASTVHSGPTTLRYGADITTPAAPTKTGYKFLGWYDAADNSQAIVNFGGKTMGTKDLVYLAKWGSDVYDITYSGMEGVTNLDKIPTQYDSASGLTLVAPTKTGYTFTGWSGDNGATAQKDVTIPVGSKGAKTYTANWTANKYTVKFDANGGTGTMGDQEFTYDMEWAIPACGFTAQPGYAFSEWNIMKGDLIAYRYQPGALVKNLADTNGAMVTLTAAWAAPSNIQYKVNHYQQNVDGNDYALFETETFTNGSVASPVTAQPKAYTGFTVKSTEAERTATINPDGTTEINVYYDRNTYNVTFDLNGGTGTPPANLTGIRYGATITAPADPIPPAGKKFSHWQDGTETWVFDTSTVQKDTTLTAIWTAADEVTYTIETYTMDTTGKYTTPTTQTLTALPGISVNALVGVTVGTGFALDTTHEGYRVSTNALVNGDVFKIYIKRNQWQLTWTWDTNKASASNYTSGSVCYGAPITAPAFTVKEGYRFRYWYVGNNTSTEVTPQTTMPNSDLSYTAMIDPISYSITLNLGGGNVTGWTHDTYHIDSGVITLPTPTRTGYDFQGWTGSNGTSPQKTVTIDPKTSKTNLSYTANWTAQKVKVWLDLGDGATQGAYIETGSETALNFIEMEYDGKYVGLPTADGMPKPMWPGHDFVGWYSGATKVENGMQLITSSEHKLVAKWVETQNVFLHKNNPDGTETGEPGGFRVLPDDVNTAIRYVEQTIPVGDKKWKSIGYSATLGGPVIYNEYSEVPAAYTYEILFKDGRTAPLHLYFVWQEVTA